MQKLVKRRMHYETIMPVKPRKETYSMKTRIIMWVASLVLIGTLNVFADEKSDSSAVSMRADIKRLMEITEVRKMGVQIMNHIRLTLTKRGSKVPWDTFMAEFDMNEFIEMVIPIYERHFTHDEIEQLIAFYESPIGKKLIKVQPQITIESMTAGQEWAKELIERVKARLPEEGAKK